MKKALYKQVSEFCKDGHIHIIRRDNPMFDTIVKIADIDGDLGNISYEMYDKHGVNVFYNKAEDCYVIC